MLEETLWRDVAKSHGPMTEGAVKSAVKSQENQKEKRKGNYACGNSSHRHLAILSKGHRFCEMRR